MTLREQLEARRRELGWTYARLAEACQDHVGFAWQGEYGTSKARGYLDEDEPLNLEVAEDIAAAMGCEIVLKMKETKEK